MIGQTMEDVQIGRKVWNEMSSREITPLFGMILEGKQQSG